MFDNDADIEDSESEDDSDADSDVSLDDDETRLKKLKEQTRKLDTLMDLVFAHFHDIFLHGTPHAINDTFEFLLLHFATHILPSYRTRHIQFLLFHYAQTSPVLAERFIARCAEITIDTQRLRPLMIRSAASAYLASFIARGAHVSRELVRAVVSLLLDRLESLRQRQAPGCTGPDVHRYGPYYAQAQALLYIFCFRWRDLVDLPSSSSRGSLSGGTDFTDPEDALAAGVELTWFSNLQSVLTLNLHSPLNPLKVCAPVLVEQFARVAHHLQFCYVYTLLAQNKRVRLGRSVTQVRGGTRGGTMHERETALSGRGGEEGLQLEAHFPFDPLRLPRCRRWVVGDYVEWRGVRGMSEGSGDEEDSEEEEEESEEDEVEEEGSGDEDEE